MIKNRRNRETRSSRLTMIIWKNSLTTGNRVDTIVEEGNGDGTEIDNATASSNSPMLSLYIGDLEMTK